MNQIFFSYRREDDPGTVGRIYDRLKHRFGDKAIFRDLDSIQLGVDFVDRISSAIDQSAAQLVLIGPKWLTIANDSGYRRLDAADDVVRMEVGTALQRGIPIIPICIDNTPFPHADQLPPDLEKLAKQNGISVRNGSDFDHDISRVITRLIECLASAPATLGPSPSDVLPGSLAQLGFKYRHVKRVDAILPPTCEVPAGPFQMGYAGHEGESPEHSITLRAFGIGTYPVTVAEYACFVRAGYHPPLDNDVTWHDQQERPNHPVVNIIWKDAVAYTVWLSKLTGQSWRLPSEAEWEKAAKWSSHTNEGFPFPWGKDFERDRCNTREGGIRTTTPIGAYAAKDSANYGAHDMAGNVWEWTNTVYRDYKYAANDGRERVDDPGPRVRRGGSWDSICHNARTTKRAWSRPETWDITIGFRLAVGAGRG